MKPANRAGPAAPILAATGLRREFDDLVALAPLELEVHPGELIALVGSNGAGKTTFLALAAGLVEPSQGTIEICGSPAGSLAARAETSYVPDTPVFYQDLSLNEHLEYIARLHGDADWSPRAAQLLEPLGLQQWGDKIPTQFSRGMRQKASIALGLIRPFSLLLADEPFDGLDPPSRDVLVELLREAAGGGAAVIVSTHRTEVADFSSRLVALHDGQLVYDGPPDRSIIAGHLPPHEAPVAPVAPVAPAAPAVPRAPVDPVAPTRWRVTEPDS